jgi:hypothetical protein
MVYVPKVEPPLDEIEIESRFTRSGRNGHKPHLIISFECLEAILGRENSVIAQEDVPRLLASLCGYAFRADIGDNALATHLEDFYGKQADDGQCTRQEGGEDGR